MFIRLNGIRIFAYHGVYEAEIRNGNHFEIDIEAELPDSAGATTDVITETLDYSELYKSVIAVSENRRYNLLEAFASDICKSILTGFPVIQCVSTKVRKIDPPIEGEINSVEIEFRSGRENA